MVRALCRVTKGHPSGAQFASASNDGIIRLWTIEGQQVAELHGHESFIYSLASLPSGELLSSGEDRSARIWRGNECIQTITHPAISVWGVAVCSDNGDIITGASDRIARVFSRDSKRQASPPTIQQFEASVKSSSIPQQQMGNINKEKLPGPGFLQTKSGTKEGQVVMIREDNGNVTAHQWSTANQRWDNVGTVVDAEGSSGRKTSFEGQDYDYVFDVDVEEGQPPLKLPYNLAQNPHDVANTFILKNNLPVTYHDQIVQFILTNTQGTTIGQSAGAGGHDPWGTGPGYQSAQPPPSDQSIPASRPKVLPQTTYLSIKAANLNAVQKKLQELNQQLIQGGSKHLSMNPSDLEAVESLVKYLEKPHGEPARTVLLGVDIVAKLVSTWPPAHKLPALDLLRLSTASVPSVAELVGPEGENVVVTLQASGVFSDPDRPNNVMLAIRALANLFQSEAGKALAEKDFDQIQSLVKPALNIKANRNITIAITTLYINYAVLFTSASHRSETYAMTLLEDLSAILDTVTDSEALYRALVAVGTLLSLGKDVQDAAKLYDIENRLSKVQATSKEPRIKGVVAEIRGFLG